MSRLLTHTFIAVGIVLGLCATATARIVLDLDASEGDQGMREMQVNPGTTIDIELVAQEGAQDIEGFEINLHFDTSQFSFKGFQPGGLMVGAITLPAQQTSQGVKLSVGFLGRKSPGDAGSLGTMQIEVASTFAGTAKIALVQGSFGAKGQTQTFPLNSEIMLTTDTPDAQQPPLEENFNQRGIGQSGPPPEVMQQMQDRWLQSPQRADMNRDGKIDGEDFRIWYDQRHAQGQPPGFQNQPQGQGYHGGPMGGDPMEPPNPEEAISRLPQALQATFMETWKFSERAHIEAELKSQERILQTLETTKRYVATASVAEKAEIGKVLMLFHMHGDEHPGGPMGPPPMPPNTNIDDLINTMIQEIQNEMAELQRVLSTM